MIRKHKDTFISKRGSSPIRKIPASGQSLTGRSETSRLPVFPVLLLLVLAFGVLAACSGKDADFFQDYSEESAAEEIPFGGDATGTGTTLPAETPFTKYKFDLTETDDKMPAYQLAYLANTDGAVIFGGETSPYYIDGAFKSTDIYSMWSPVNFSYQVTDPVYDYAYSMDKTSIAFLVHDGDSAYPNLTYFDGSEASEISPCSGYFCISGDGSAVAYIRDGSLFVWDSRTKKSVLITEDATESFTLSPSGKYICYSTGKDFFCYAAPVGGEPVEIGISCSSLAITDDGSLIYYYDSTESPRKLCVNHAGNIVVLDESAAILKSSLTFNQDCTQIVFPINDIYYFSMNGGKPIRATGGDVVDTNPAFYTNDSFVRIIKIDGHTIAPYFVENKNLCNLLFRNGTELSFFDEDLNVFSFPVDEYTHGYLSEGGKALLYGSNNPNSSQNTYTFVSDFSDPACAKEILDDKYIWYPLLNANGTIYYRNDIGQLFMIRGSAEPVKIDTYVENLNTMVIGDSSYVYYLKDMLNNGTFTLCRIEDVPGAKSVVVDKGVCDLDICDAGLVYRKRSETLEQEVPAFDVYFADDGLHGEKIFKLDYSY